MPEPAIRTAPDHDTITIPICDDRRPDDPVALRDNASGVVHPLAQARLIVGSSPRADLRLEDVHVSAVHCIIERLACGRVVVRDQGSKNGVFVDGHRVNGADLRPGTELRLGRTSLSVLSAHALAGPSPADELVGEAPVFRAAIELAQRVGRSPDCSVLILGETGTGKELVARLIHDSSPRVGGAFITVNCGGLTSTLIASELFGHTRGAFTGAHTDHPGVFVQADGGTLFLDELGELPLDQQPHLLRALESGDVRPLGSSQSKRVDVRFIAATNKLDLATHGSLRQDLYHRLATIVVRLPPLRDRPTDIPLLIQEFMRREGCDRHISPRTMQRLVSYPWRGNVRELRHAVKRAITLAGDELTVGAFLPELGPRLTEASTRSEASAYDAGVKEVLEAALLEHRSVRQAARALGLPKSTFADRAKRLGVRLDIGRRGR